MRSVIQLYLAANYILLMCEWNHTFSFLRSLLRENGRLLHWPFKEPFVIKSLNNNKKNKLGYRKISWFVSVSNITIFCSTLSNNCQLFPESGISQMLYNMIVFWVKLFVFPNIFIEQNQSWPWTDFAKYERFSTTSKIPSKGILPHPPTTGSVTANGLLSFPLTV